MSRTPHRQRATHATPPTRPLASPSAGRRTSGWLIPVVAIVLLLALTAAPGLSQSPHVVRVCDGVALLLAGWLALTTAWTRRQGRALVFRVDLRPQHYVQACAHLTIYLYWASQWGEVSQAAPLIAAQLVFAYAFDALLTWTRGEDYVLGFGPFPIIFSTNLFLWFRPDWFEFQFLMIAVGFAAKALIRWTRDGRRTHIFNPSSFTLSLFSVVLLATGRSEITWGPQIAVTQLLPPQMYLLIFLVALPGQFLFGVAAMTVAAVGSTFAFTMSYYAATGTHYFIEPSIPIAVFLGMHLLFTDPSTAPRSELGRIVFGVLYATSVIVLFSVLQRAGFPGFYDKLLAVPLLNLLVPFIDRLAANPALHGIDPARLAPRWSRRQRHLAYMGVWAVVFTAMQLATRDHVALARADVLAALNRPDEAIAAYRTLLARSPEMPHAEGKLGLTLLRAGRFGEATSTLEQAARQSPPQADVYTNLGLAHLQQGHAAQATAAFQQAVAIDDRNPELRFNLAQLLAEQHPAEAARHLREALRLRPEWPTAMGALAWLQATEPDFAGSSASETLALARRASELSQEGDPAILDALGAAYAASSQFEQAVATADRAESIAVATSGQLVSGIRARRDLYRQRKGLANTFVGVHTAPR